MKNMKIEINAEQPLDEVIKELERLGYKTGFTTNCDPYFLDTEDVSWLGGWVYNVRDKDDYSGSNTTLQQLRGMK